MKQLIHLTAYSFCLFLLAIFTIAHTSTVTLVTDVIGIAMLVAALWLAQSNTNKLAGVLALCGISTLTHLPVGLWIIGLFVNEYSDTLLLAANVLYYSVASLLTLIIWYYAITMYRTPNFFDLTNGTLSNVRTYVLGTISIVILMGVVLTTKYLRVTALIF